MRSTHHQHRSQAVLHRAQIPVCSCGQDLDCVHGTHCPRCGTTLHVGPALAQAA
jgi:hypothetical protein